MADESVLEQLEKRIYQALKKIAEQQQTIQALRREKQECRNLLEEKVQKVQALQQELENVRTRTEDELVQKYQEREQQLKSRLQELLLKIDKVNLF